MKFQSSKLDLLWLLLVPFIFLLPYYFWYSITWVVVTISEIFGAEPIPMEPPLWPYYFLGSIAWILLVNWRSLVAVVMGWIGGHGPADNDPPHDESAER